MKNNKIKNFFRRIGKTRFLILCFIPFGAYGFYHDGWLGFFVAVFGWCLGGVIYNWKESKQSIITFLKRRTHFQIKMMFFVPIAAVCTYYQGWRGLLVAILGWCVGELISRRIFK